MLASANSSTDTVSFSSFSAASRGSFPGGAFALGDGQLR